MPGRRATTMAFAFRRSARAAAPGTPVRHGGRMRAAAALGLLAGAAADAVFADPRRGHPVALFGRAAAALERRLYAGSRARGAAYAALCTRRRGRARPRRARAHPEPAVGEGRGHRRRHLGGARRHHASAGRAPTSPTRWSAGTSPRPGRGCPTCAGATRAGSTRPSSPAPRSSRWPRTPPTRWSPRWCGARSPGCPACSATGRSTRSTRWSATARRATRDFGWAAARLDDVANLRPGPAHRRARRRSPRRVAGGSPRRALAVLRRDGAPAPQPERGPVRGRVRRRARRPARRRQRLRRPGRAPPPPRRRRPPARRRHRAAPYGSPARSASPPPASPRSPPRGPGAPARRARLTRGRRAEGGSG